MKCERCGNQLDDTDLFCPKCGKAVFEEYMDDDDIWDEYDREPKAEPEEELEVELERSKPVQPEQHQRPKKQNKVKKRKIISRKRRRKYRRFQTKSQSKKER